MTQQKEQQLSKFLSYILRHKPENIGIKLDEHGWIDIDTLINNINTNSEYRIDRETLENIVKNDSKQRYKIDGSKIRASQGHSLKVDLQLKEETPPIILYHGTSDRFEVSIKKKGLLPMSRTHVHLSDNIRTAVDVGSRHGGKVMICKIDCKQMIIDGYKFYRSDNGVWLVDSVPMKYISINFLPANTLK